jgi:hypothetical protein
MVQEVLQLAATTAPGAGGPLAPQAAAAMQADFAAAPADMPRRQGWTPFMAGPQPPPDSPQPLPPAPTPASGDGSAAAPSTPAGVAEGDIPPASSPLKLAEQFPLPAPRWVFSLAGHVIAALVGLSFGYLLLHWLRPESFPSPW